MKNIRAVVDVTNSRPKRRPMVVLSSSVEVRRVALLLPSLGPAGPSRFSASTDSTPRVVSAMQLCHTHRQLLSRCSLRWYSVGTSSDTISPSDVQAPSRLKRPVASSFGGINIRMSRLLLVSPNLIPFSPYFFFLRKCRGAYTISLT
jgi:hypothetical protein